MFGGVENVEKNDRTNGVQTSYIKVPSLRHLSWQTINQNCDLFSKMPEKLKEEGIPPDLIAQLMY